MSRQLRAELARSEHLDGFKLRDQDAREIFKQTLCDPEIAVRNALASKASELWAVLNKQDKVLCFFGATRVSQLAESAVAFALTGEYANLHAMEFALRSRKIAQGMIKKYGYLFNNVDAEYVECHKWLEFCGFTVEYDNSVLINGYKFYPFHGGNLDV